MNFTESTGVYIKIIRNHLCNILWVFGLWMPIDESKWKQISYTSFSVIFLTIFSMIYSISMVINIFLLTDFSDLTNRLFMSLTESALAIKVINFFFNNREWQNVLKDIESFQILSLEEEKIIKYRTKMVQIFLPFYYMLPNLAVQGFGIAPILSGGAESLFSGWYPGLDWENNKRDYWIIYAYQYIGIFITANLNVTIDAYYCFVMHTLSAQINIFGERLSSIKVDKGDVISDQQLQLNLIQQIHAHQRLNARLRILQRNLQWTYFCQVLLSGIVICSVVKELARTPISDDPALFMTTVLILSSFLMQIFLICLFGEEIMSEYDSLSYQLFSSDWPNIIAKSKYSHIILIMFMETLKCEKKLTIGKVYTLGLKTFSSVLNVAYRLFTFLK